MNLDENTRVCLNCYQSINNEIAMLQADPTCLKLNVLNQRRNRACALCNAENGLSRLSLQSRVNVFIRAKIYVPEDVRFCPHHLNPDGLIIPELIQGLRSTYRPYRIPRPQIQVFLKQLRNVAAAQPRLENAFESLTDEDFSYLFSVNRQQFDDLFHFCDPVPEAQTMRHVKRKDLMTYLCKIGQGLPDELLKILFCYSSRQAVSMAISTVRKSLTMRFIPTNIGTSAINRQDFINQHVTPFANQLYNDQPEIPQAIVLCNSTYAYIHKSSNFRVLRQSFSMHKHRHLLKPTLLVGTEGYILVVLGPYFSDYYNNDAAILQEEFEKDGQVLRDWFQDGDIMLVDRGYRDVLPFLRQMGIHYKMPALLRRGQNQLTTEQANQSRLITKNRWLVESRNGHFRTIFKYFDHVFNIQNAKHIGDDYRIAGGLINRYHPLIHMQGATIDLAREMLQRAERANTVKARVQVDHLLNRRAVWERVHDQMPHFPRLDINYLRDITVGVYQVNLSRSYIQDKLQRDDDEEFQIDTLIEDNNLIRIRFYSRFRRATKHQVFITFNNENEVREENDLITGYYCTCPTGARTLGTCAHIASILWYLRYARHQQNVRYPDGSLLNVTFDAAHREEQEDLNNVDIID